VTDISGAEPPAPGLPDYSGTWERKGRSPIAAGVAGLVGIGLIYSYGQSILATIIMLAQGRLTSTGPDSETFFERLGRLAELRKYPILISVIFTQALLMFLPTLWIVRRWHTPDVRSYLRFQPTRLRAVMFAALATILFFPTNVYLSALFVSALNIPKEFIEINQKLFSASGPAEFLFLVIAIGVTPAICEETLFRGYAQRTFERNIGWKSIIVVGALFGLYHMQPLGLFSLSGLGMLFGYFYYQSRSILPGMVAHFTNNVLAVLIYSSAAARGALDLHSPHIGMVLLTLPLAGAMVYLFQKIFREPAPQVEIF
jgi:hypothetical protein